MTNYLFREDCRKTVIRKLNYHYVWTGPPDYDEIGMEPIKDDEKYLALMSDIFSQLKPKNDLITLFSTDRKYKGKIIPRHSMLADVMAGLGYEIRNYKIWVKGQKKNLYRLQYSHIITYGSGKVYQDKEYQYDVFYDEPLEDKDAQPPSLIEKCIRNHTKKRQRVLDPFIGIGNTAIASNGCGRHFVGSEIVSSKHRETKKLLTSLGIQFATKQ